MSIINPSLGIVFTSSTALSASKASLITNDYISKLKLRYTKLRDWINVITLLYEKTLKESKIDEKDDQKETEQLKQISNHYIEKGKKIMNSIKFKVEDIFGDVFFKDSSSLKRRTNLIL